MKNNKIKFQQQRDFGEIINATFTFVSQEFKLLLQSILYFAGPFLLLGGIFLGKGQANLFTQLDNTSLFSNPSDYFSNGFTSIFLGGLFLTLGITAIITLINSYVAIYTKQEKNNFTIEVIWKEFKRNYFRLLGTNMLLSILFGIIGVISIFLLGIPFIYLAVSTSFIFIIQVVERKGYIDALSRSFFLIKGKWFMTFGLLILSVLIIYFVSMVIGYPFGILIAFLQSYVPESNFDFLSLIMIIYSVISTIFYYSLFGVLHLLIAFQYFNMVEQKEYPDLMIEIKEINQ